MSKKLSQKRISAIHALSNKRPTAVDALLKMSMSEEFSDMDTVKYIIENRQLLSEAGRKFLTDFENTFR